ncbi:CaiB/BaiF CoA transferase family protein [Nitrospirillum viridazoti]|uniref:Crotonobetainyl-CoA:carnitine CoA-transferase CaiB-like acyl-CoA transferase n=1 Tax=Nitrospirillum amazonense TaxID=28077 RepID=A0A560HJY7_9PROT|nr:CoA transferase [Nitrospirillum amazonense]TWB46815.1 crotonobetainyl-CoA:carnitine CoA-transferase CaiB-like acyl-CoA transferase [Nitrospirillum amazonense]
MKLPMGSLPPAPAGTGGRLLDGIRVLDLTTSIAGPYATLLLSDLGADVIKVERPGTGDDTRAWGPPFLAGHSLWYLGVNRNKQSITLDYSTPEGLAALHKLVRHCDAVVVNLVPRVQRKLKVDYETLSALRPDIIFCSITGFGLEGERADKPSYDLIAEGYSGIMDITGEADSPPQKVGAPAADMLSGMDAAMAIIAALFQRQRSGMGHSIDISMVESMTRFLTPRIMTYLGSGEVPRRTGAKDSVIAVYQSFETADLPLTLGLGNDRIWQRFWDAVGHPDYAQDPRFSSNAKRHALRPEIVARIQELLLEKNRNEWLRLFEAKGIPCGPINRIDEIAADQELARRGFFYQMEMGGIQVPQVGLGIAIDGHPASPRSAPPALGADTTTVLRDLAGLDDEQINTLRNKSII